MAITFEKVSKWFGDHRVLNDLTFEIADSEKVTLIGPSGSGKTTILRLLMTLEQPNAGRILIDGEPLWDMDVTPSLSKRAEERRLAQMRREVGMVFQQFNLFPNMTARDNVASPLRFVAKQGTEEARSHADQLLDSVGLAEKGDSYPTQLSGGQQQRVAIARALALQPKIMLFDEVTSALDPELVGEVLAVLKDLAENTSMTMLFVTHQMEFAAEISDRVLMFDSGQIIEDKSPTELFSNPTELRTQKFLSSLRWGMTPQ